MIKVKIIIYSQNYKISHVIINILHQKLVVLKEKQKFEDLNIIKEN